LSYPSSIIVKILIFLHICHHENNLLDPCLQMVQISGTMDMFEELLENLERCQAPPNHLRLWSLSTSC
jgi:hypothetical protein